MDEIYLALCKAHTAIQWFSFGDAVRLADEIYKICIAYAKSEVDDDKLLKVAERTCLFLSSNNGPPTRNESYKALSDALHNHKIG